MKQLGSVLLLAAAVSRAADVNVIESIVAKVNGDIITRSEIDRERRRAEVEMRKGGLLGEQLIQALADREKDILRDRIDQLLLVQKGKELNINVDPEVSKYLAQLQLEGKISDPDKFQEWIKEQTGMPYEDFRAETRNGLLTQRVIRQEVGGRINVPRSDIEKYYEEHKTEFVREDRVFLREILVSTEGKKEPEIAAAEKKAKDLVARARKGERFGELARDNSDSVTARAFGELGGWKRGELDKQIEDIVFAQEKNYVTDPIRRPNGFLILKVEEKHKAGQPQIEEVENEIMERLYAPRMQPAVRAYLTKLREEAFLEIREGYIDSAPAPGKDTKWVDPAELKPETVTKEEVANQTRRRRLLWAIPIPGTKTGTPAKKDEPKGESKSEAVK